MNELENACLMLGWADVGVVGVVETAPTHQTRETVSVAVRSVDERAKSAHLARQHALDDGVRPRPIRQIVERRPGLE